MPKKIQVTVKLLLFHMLVRFYSKSFKKASAACELRISSDIQTGFRKDRGTRDQIANICWIIEKTRGL